MIREATFVCIVRHSENPRATAGVPGSGDFTLAFEFDGQTVTALSSPWQEPVLTVAALAGAAHG